MKFAAHIIWWGVIALGVLFALAVMLTILGSESRAQELPDAPSPHCQRAKMDERGVVHFEEVPCANNFPEEAKALPPRTWKEYSGKKATFFTVRRYDAPVPLRTTKEQVLSPAFIVSEGTMWGAGVADMYVNGCKGNAPCGAELKVDALVPLTVVSVSHFFLSKYMGATVGSVGPTMAFGIHIKGLVTGVWP